VPEDKNQDRSTQHLANERTFLAWLRTSVVIIGLGFIIAKFSLLAKELGLIVSDATVTQNMSGESPSVMLGIGVIAFGIALVLYAIKNYLNAHKAIESRAYASRHSIVYFAGIGMIAVSIIIITYLALTFS
jgi:putative membrane protein